MCRSERESVPSAKKFIHDLHISSGVSDGDNDLVEFTNRTFAETGSVTNDEGDHGNQKAAENTRAYGSICQQLFQRRSARPVGELDLSAATRRLYTRDFGAMITSSITGARPTQDPQFEEEFEGHLYDQIPELPHQLNLDSKAGKEALMAWGQDPVFKGGTLIAFSSWVGDLQTRSSAQAGERGLKLLYLGEPTHGRLIWMAAGQIVVPKTEGERSRVRKITRCLRRLEAQMVDLACIITYRLVSAIVFECAAEMAEAAGRPLLSREDVSRAVEEILGRDWFDLPFDTSDMLRSWAPLWELYEADALDEVLRRD